MPPSRFHSDNSIQVSPLTLPALFFPHFFTHAQSQVFNFIPNKSSVFQGFCQNGKVSRILTKCSKNLKSKSRVSHHLESADNDSNQAGEPLGMFNQAVVQINLILSWKCFEHEKPKLSVLTSASSPPLCLILPNSARHLENFQSSIGLWQWRTCSSNTPTPSFAFNQIMIAG